MNKDFILKKRKDFLRVAKGEYTVASTVLLQAAPSLSEHSTSYKIGFTATKKIGKAHIRNRTKRRLRAAAREIFPKFALSNYDYVIIGRFNTAVCPYEVLLKDLKGALKKLNHYLIKNAAAKEKTVSTPSREDCHENNPHSSD